MLSVFHLCCPYVVRMSSVCCSHLVPILCMLHQYVVRTLFVCCTDRVCILSICRPYFGCMWFVRRPYFIHILFVLYLYCVSDSVLYPYVVHSLTNKCHYAFVFCSMLLVICTHGVRMLPVCCPCSVRMLSVFCL